MQNSILKHSQTSSEWSACFVQKQNAVVFSYDIDDLKNCFDDLPKLTLKVATQKMFFHVDIYKAGFDQIDMKHEKPRGTKF